MKCHYTYQVTRTAQVQETAPSTSKKNRKIWLQNMNEEQADSLVFPSDSFAPAFVIFFLKSSKLGGHQYHVPFNLMKY